MVKANFVTSKPFFKESLLKCCLAFLAVVLEDLCVMSWDIIPLELWVLSIVSRTCVHIAAQNQVNSRERVQEDSEEEVDVSGDLTQLGL